jgi:hypothetical protein
MSDTTWQWRRWEEYTEYHHESVAERLERDDEEVFADVERIIVGALAEVEKSGVPDWMIGPRKDPLWNGHPLAPDWIDVAVYRRDLRKTLERVRKAKVAKSRKRALNWLRGWHSRESVKRRRPPPPLSVLLRRDKE